MQFTLQIWRQSSADESGRFVNYQLEDVSPDMSFLEMLDILNERLIREGQEPVEFDHDCREGICGSCGLFINGQAHGPDRNTTTCEVRMRRFRDGETIIIEPWRAKAFPVIRDLVVDRGALDRIVQAGGYTSVKTGPHADANAMLIPKADADNSMDAAACIGCGACVAACPNASASLFTGAKVTQYAYLPQGQPERFQRAERMAQTMDDEGFGSCTNIGECTSACPKGIPLSVIAQMKADYFKSFFKALFGRI